MRSVVMVGSSVWVVSGRWMWLAVGCSVCVASARYLRPACWCGCVDGGGLSACPPVELVPALGGCLCARLGAVVCGGGGRVGALGAWWAWLGVGARVDVYLVRAAGGLRAAGVLLPCVWRVVLSGGAWLLCALRGWCQSGCLGLGAGCGCVVCAMWWGVMVGSPTCAAGWTRVWSVVWCPVRAVRVGSVWARWWWWLWLDCLVVVVVCSLQQRSPGS